MTLTQRIVSTSSGAANTDATLLIQKGLMIPKKKQVEEEGFMVWFEKKKQIKIKMIPWETPDFEI